MFSGWRACQRGAGLWIQRPWMTASALSFPITGPLMTVRRDCGYYESPHSVQSHAPGVHRPITHTPTDILPPPSAIEPEDQAQAEEVISLVDEQIQNQSYGRLFAVLYADQRQFKVTPGDLIMLNHDLGIIPGSKIVLDKVLLVGGRDFSLIGRPVLPRDLVQIDATVVEKALSKPIFHFFTGRRIKQARMRFHRERQTTIRINNIILKCPIEAAQDRTGFETRKDDPTFL
ncbi:hypothetical protein TCAL_05556 [Tigriopus californicus]|uniref:Large ribosomal subunit protein bL21m n=1 Tax=Tigriopus californicus TaxID=6832 RepID=A0A553P8D4_TIGCA|nr:large ribosomal subunit protein bL21m-like [Tigriopus californicus]TRY73951.1 hypothetical protein TCAL_05556 [Tigriopus californicus]|eukprot:TCALIF_05556-PA protein Name:"Similar to MRPL21 39S ribosomal protein L21, mitochondrial (Bos taurus)" AED:0.04 eAED:0.04 QI:99/1/1/1/1/1/4/641/230